MQRLNDAFLDTLHAKLDFGGKSVLEIGCGDGARSVELARLCMRLEAVDPDEAALTVARRDHAAGNLTYSQGRAEQLAFADAAFDSVIFSLSLHHVPVAKMAQAITEAARVSKPEGRIVFLEPAFYGSFFEAELQFGSGDGDERKEKAAAYYAILNSSLPEVEEYYDEVTFKFDSADDFIATLSPRKHHAAIEKFLMQHNFELLAQRRINICRP